MNKPGSELLTTWRGKVEHEWVDYNGHMSESCSEFALPEVKLGLVADSGGLQRLPRAIATELLLTGRRMSAQEACNWGLVNKIVPALALMQTAHDLAALIVQNAPLALAAVKQVLRETDGQTVAQAYHSISKSLLSRHEAEGSATARQGETTTTGMI